jgi:hypothetical protein
MGKYYALIRMEPLSISCAEDFVVISCRKVDYDKSGWRVDRRQMCLEASRLSTELQKRIGV